MMDWISINMISETWNPEVDLFAFIIYWISGWTAHKVVRIYAAYSFLVHVFTVFVQTYYMITTFDSIYLVQYGPAYFGVLFALNTVVTGVIISKPIKEIHYYLWTNGISIDRMPQELKDAAAKNITSAKLFIIFNNFFVIIAVSAMISDVTNESKVYFIIEWFRGIYPNGVELFIFAYYITFPFISYLMVIPLYGFLYFVLHANLQATNLTALTMRHLVEMPSGKDDMLLIKDDEYQAHISGVLALVATRHSLITGSIKLASRGTGFGVLTFFICGILLGVSILYYSQVLVYLPVRGMVRFASMGFVSFLDILAYSYLGQIVVDMIDELEDTFIKAPWYCWDTKNRKEFLFVLMNSCQIRNGLTVSSLISVNLSLILRMCKTIYSIGSIITVQSLNQINAAQK